ncbi:cointegrate resolution protein S [Pseudomonas chlororaphis subsp. piscium]|uniref:hypothetical protein n=1 Tax=Pseudomonas chlororaphis TaxID=587753 RepID=UPI000F711732|nr:hypothetical protein [Pseudomonas chlororaphis]AZC51728.1 cointegrate resolution protein S [Pseudomonas chlororaphis subsp. piscium]
MQLFLPSSKTDRNNRGRRVSVPALKRLCSVEATQQWLELSGIKEGVLFRAIDRWGHVGKHALNRQQPVGFAASGFSTQRRRP